VCRSQPADFSQLPVRSETAVIPEVIVRKFSLENHFIDAIFLGKFRRFSWNKIQPESKTCEDGIRDAREKHYVSPGTPGTEIKPTPLTTEVGWLSLKWSLTLTSSHGHCRTARLLGEYFGSNVPAAGYVGPDTLNGIDRPPGNAPPASDQGDQRER
jgi:hypothetical protein